MSKLILICCTFLSSCCLAFCATMDISSSSSASSSESRASSMASDCAEGDKQNLRSASVRAAAQSHYIRHDCTIHQQKTNRISDQLLTVRQRKDVLCLCHCAQTDTQNGHLMSDPTNQSWMRQKYNIIHKNRFNSSTNTKARTKIDLNHSQGRKYAQGLF